MKKKFENERTFEAYNDACKWLKENGYSYGSMCSPAPTAIVKGNYYIAKWRNLTTKERNEVDGTITGDFRNGPVTVEVYER
jgi:hypothetical protein